MLDGRFDLEIKKYSSSVGHANCPFWYVHIPVQYVLSLAVRGRPVFDMSHLLGLSWFSCNSTKNSFDMI